MRNLALAAALLGFTQISFSSANDNCTQFLVFTGKVEVDSKNVLKPNEISYRVFGENNSKTIVLVHGLGGSKETWTRVAQKLEDAGYRVVIFDQRGHGETVVKGEDYSSKLLAADLKSLLDSLGINRAHVVGHSMGGRTVTRFAKEYPDYVSSLIVEDMHMKGRSKLQDSKLELSRKITQAIGTAEYPTRQDAVSAVKRAAEVYRQDFISRCEKNEDGSYSLTSEPYAYLGDNPITKFRSENDMLFLADKIFSKYLGRYLENIQVTEDGRVKLQPRPDVVMLYSQQGLQEELGFALEEIQTPQLFMAASIDPVLYGMGIEHTKEHSPKAEVKTAPGADHGIHYSAFGWFMETLLEFVRRVDSN